MLDAVTHGEIFFSKSELGYEMRVAFLNERPVSCSELLLILPLPQRAKDTGPQRS